MEEMQSMALKSMEMREEVEKQFRQLKLDKDATIERLSAVTGTLDAAVKDAVSAAMKDGPEQELKRVKASLKALSSPQGGGVLQSPPRTTIHHLEFFAHLRLESISSTHSRTQYQITVTLVRGSDASSLASAVAPSCKLCSENDKWWPRKWVHDPEALRQCVTGLLGSRGAASGQQRWAYVAYCRIDNLSYIDTRDLEDRKPLPPDVFHDVASVDWLQAWLRSSSEEAITDADVRRPERS
eukprot:2977238-Amphidinium_carterae.1